MEKDKTTKILLIPSYEPDEKLIELLKKVDRKLFEVVVVNDGSDKSYNNIFKVAKKYSKVLEYEGNMGKGYALKTGIKYIKDTYKKDYIVITMDSDGQHTVFDATKLGEYVKDNRDVLVLGMRLRDEKVPLRSKFGNTITKFIYSITTNLNVYDTQTGLRAFSDKLTDFLLNIKGNRFEYEMNVLLYASSNEILIKEIPIQTIYIENNHHSHFHTFKDSYLVYKEIIKFSLSSILSFIIDYILFIIGTLLFKNITVSNILARTCSSICNYTINRNLVFRHNKKMYRSATLYFSLVIANLALNTLLLNILVQFMINTYIAKVLVEIFMFIISWFIQKKQFSRKEFE